MQLPTITKVTWKTAVTDSREQFIRRFNLKEGSKVLVTCCGIGIETILAAEAVGPRGFVVGIDINKEAIEIANTKVRQAKLKNVQLVCGDATNLDPTITDFDFVCCLFGLHFFQDPESVLSYWGQRLKIGGTLGIASWLQSGPEEVLKPMREIVQRYLVKSGEPLKKYPQLKTNWTNIREEIIQYKIDFPSTKVFWELQKQNDMYTSLKKKIGSDRFYSMEQEVKNLLADTWDSPFSENVRIKFIFAELN